MATIVCSMYFSAFVWLLWHLRLAVVSLPMLLGRVPELKVQCIDACAAPSGKDA